ncbi:uncharacterized protein LACBIDRAFT_296220 [Laccaria bicolor S238N-H82]|uniref:Predicted protein n=1 Tax=Laccaria bicolor (strain S238N-H82 / ATCC MYA-4686) TaxID=486041 RepID=B0D895_LACBS|nr:uncharacterized protein LACBIDRAFT_296220 [Laccaria bicolor S238N-H82]EDR09042.1 predicted protein [Laccaria bicolor S238N-H82]|eukprot:XP_001880355.1 predicted protein [Laccaria bicolor S238N-H82]
MANTSFSVGQSRARNVQSATRSSTKSTSASVSRNSAPMPTTLRIHQAQLFCYSSNSSSKPNNCFNVCNSCNGLNPMSNNIS